MKNGMEDLLCLINKEVQNVCIVYLLQYVCSSKYPSNHTTINGRFINENDLIIHISLAN
jgi:hypothetical protein